MSKKTDQPTPLSEAMEDHSAEGIAIMTSEPARLTSATILVIAALLVSALVWSFFGSADVIVTAMGTLEPEGEIRRFYAPIDGELVDLYVAEGAPVSAGDVVARLNARGAIEAATQALDADLRLAEAEREFQRFPDVKKLLLRESEALKRQVEIELHAHEKRVSEGLTKLAQAQKARLEEARSALRKAARARDIARGDMEKYQRLIKRAGGGGVSRATVEEKRTLFLEADANHGVAEARLGQLDFELSQEMAQAKAELEGSDQKMTELRIKYDTATKKVEIEEHKARMKLRSAQLAAEAAARVSFDNIDEDNFLRIVAPVSGIVTNLTFTQPGDKVQANTPLGSIAPEAALPVLKLEISEQDRGFLREGLAVKMKFNAFPYQRFGFIDGVLEYISPATEPSATTKQPVYKGHVSLERDYYEVGGTNYPLRYGMSAIAEIVVRKRRMIDLALDPFRNVEG